jgi:PBSX family phage terminase large subunit
MTDIKLSQKIAPIFYPVHKAIRNETHDEFWLKGGRGSTKSSFTPEEIVLGMIQDRNANAIAFRKVSRTIRDSIQGSFNWAIDELGLTSEFDSISSPAEITYKSTGQKIILRGLDEPRKLKSIRLRHGYFKYLWFEEADEFNGDGEIRSVEQSILRGGKKFIEFFTYNPPKNPKHWINKMAELDQDSKFIHHSTYLDIPREWLGDKFFQKAERLKENNYEAYAHEYLGKAIGNPEEIVFSGKYEVRDFETPDLKEVEQNRFFFGADWGFANDPTVLIRCFIKDDCLWIDYEAYGLQIEIDHIGKSIFDKIPESRNWIIEADSARPETISNVKRQGFRVNSVEKWKGSVEDGIEYLKSFKKIIIHPRCKRIVQEFEIYSYKVDKNTKEILPQIDDKKDRLRVHGDKMGIKDDGIDSLRYALSKYIKRKIITWTGFSV